MFESPGSVCPFMPAVAESHVYYEDTLQGVRVTYTCNRGYEFPDGSTVKKIQCLMDGTWSLYPPACQGSSSFAL